MLPTILYRSQHFWELLHPFAHDGQHGRNNSQQQCCELLRPFARSLKSDAKNVQALVGVEWGDGGNMNDSCK